MHRLVTDWLAYTVLRNFEEMDRNGNGKGPVGAGGPDGIVDRRACRLPALGSRLYPSKHAPWVPPCCVGSWDKAPLSMPDIHAADIPPPNHNIDAGFLDSLFRTGRCAARQISREGNVTLSVLQVTDETNKRLAGLLPDMRSAFGGVIHDLGR